MTGQPHAALNLADLPTSPPATARQLVAAVRSGARVVVIDDDPTGTQGVSGIPIITRWQAGDLRWAFDQPGVGFCVLTNTRSVDVGEARRRNAEVIDAVHRAAAGQDYVVISRGDSTLRGHHWNELDELRRSLARVGWGAVDAVLVVPAFPNAGRITVDSVHWIRENGAYLPAGRSSFAQDATFGYRASDLRDFTQESSGGVLAASQVLPITLGLVRGDIEILVQAIMAVSGGRHVVVDAADEQDLRRIAMAAIEAEARGRRLLYRTSPGLLRARLGQSETTALTTAQLADAVLRAAPSTRHGLVVVGSHVPTSTRQLSHLLANAGGVEHIVVDVPALVEPATADQTITDAARRAVAALESSDVVVSTSRTRIDGGTGEESLRIARAVSRGVVAITSTVLAHARPSYLVGKGGITSSDLATHAVGLQRARVLGSLLPGMVSVWQGADSTIPGTFDTPYAVFPGNVGGDEALTQAMLALRAASNSTG